MSKFKVARACWSLLALLAVGETCLAEEKVDRNVVYGMYSGTALLMDVYRPANANGIGVIMIPGSGWEAPLGYDASPLKDSYAVRAILALDRLVEAGYVVFVINHRATPRFRFPAPLEDAQRAVRFVRHNAEKFGIDPDRIGGVGGSSGGHLINLLGTMDSAGVAEATDPVERASARIQAVVAVYSVSDLARFTTSNPWAGGAISALIGPVNPAWKPPPLYDPEAAAIYARASPITHVSHDDPPFLLIHGDADSVVPYSQSEALLHALSEAGVDAELIRIPGGDHGPGLLIEDGPDYVTAMIRWLDETLRDGT